MQQKSVPLVATLLILKMEPETRALYWQKKSRVFWDWIGQFFFETKCVVSKQNKLHLTRKKKEKIKRRPYTQKEREYICKFADYDDLKSIAEALDRTPKAIKDQISLLKKSELFEQYKKRYDERQARTVG